MPVAPVAPPRVMFNPAALAAQPGGAVTLTIQVENVTDLFSAPLRLKFDPNVLRLTEAARGAFMAGDGRDVLFTRNILNETGDLTVILNRMPGTGGISGSGTLVTLDFQVVGQGVTTVTVPELAFQDSRSQTILSASPQVTVTIK
jgi:general secretion pathway protein D